MALGSGIRDPGSGKNLFRIPDPGGQKGTGSRFRIRNTAFRNAFSNFAARPTKVLYVRKHVTNLTTFE